MTIYQLARYSIREVCQQAVDSGSLSKSAARKKENRYRLMRAFLDAGMLYEVYPEQEAEAIIKKIEELLG